MTVYEGQDIYVLATSVSFCQTPEEHWTVNRGLVLGLLFLVS